MGVRENFAKEVQREMLREGAGAVLVFFCCEVVGSEEMRAG